MIRRHHETGAIHEKESLPCILYASWSILFLTGLARVQAADLDQIPPLHLPHAEIPPGFWEQHGTSVVLVAVLVALLLGLVVWLLARPKPPVVVTPEAAARRELEALRAQAKDGLLLSHVSQILRRYVAGVFGLPPGERTTTEFCAAITNHPQIGVELASALAAFLRRCDEVKFSPSPEKLESDAVPQALALIDQAEARKGGMKNAE